LCCHDDDRAGPVNRTRSTTPAQTDGIANLAAPCAGEPATMRKKRKKKRATYTHAQMEGEKGKWKEERELG